MCATHATASRIGGSLGVEKRGREYETICQRIKPLIESPAIRMLRIFRVNSPLASVLAASPAELLTDDCRLVLGKAKIPTSGELSRHISRLTRNARADSGEYYRRTN